MWSVAEGSVHSTRVPSPIFAASPILRKKATDATTSLNPPRHSGTPEEVDFVDYSRYPWIDDAKVIDGIRLASPRDIAAMKINAVEGRGTKKDFIDIYALLQYYSLSEILGFYNSKYPEHSTFRALMSLTYFEDADEQMPPLVFDMPEWEVMKDHIRSAVSSFNG